MAKAVRVRVLDAFSDAWIVKSANTAWRSNVQSGGQRFVKFEGLKSGEGFVYELIVVGNKAGEHDWKLSVSVDGKYQTTFSGRAVVLP